MLLAISLLALIHLFVARIVVVESTSMYATLLPGDLLLVDLVSMWDGPDRNDIVVFRDPIGDHLPIWERELLVKRIVGMPGDKVQIRDGDLFVNEAYIPPPERSTTSFVLRTSGSTPIDGIPGYLQLPIGAISTKETPLVIPLNDSLAHLVKNAFPGIEVELMGTSTGASLNIFPFSQQHRWNNDRFGPIEIPAKGDTIAITTHNFPLYDRIMSKYEGHELSVSGDTLLIDGAELQEYVIEQDHYFMLGDSRDHSADSRYWGFVPADHLVGRVACIIASSGPNGARTDRVLRHP